MTTRSPDISELKPHVDADGMPLLLAWQKQVGEIIDAQAKRIEQLERMVFGQRSEKMPPMQREVTREARAAEVQTIAQRLAESEGRTQPTAEDVKKARRKAGRTASEPAREQRRKQRAETAPILEQTVDVTPDDLPDGMSMGDFRTFGQGDVRTVVSYVKSHFVIKRFVLQKVQHIENSSLIVQAPMPQSALVTGGKYDATCHTQCVVSRILDLMPLQRQARQSARDGYAMAPSVLVNLFHRTAFLLQDVYVRLVNELQRADYLCADETPQPMQAPGTGKTARGWMWMALCDSVIAYRFDASRSTEAGKKLLGETVRNLMADGYSGYNGLVLDRAACWSHARRGIFEARENWPAADEILHNITALYRVEFDARLQGASSSELRDLRRARSRPILDRIFDLVQYEALAFSPSSVQAKALSYLIKRQMELRKFVEDPRIPLDNNISERALRVVALGRKNSLFVGPGENGQDLAILLTVVQTCQLHQIDPSTYLNDVLPKLSRLQTQQQVDAEPIIVSLMPAQWARARAPSAPE